jgi:hypothetical protein
MKSKDAPLGGCPNCDSADFTKRDWYRVCRSCSTCYIPPPALGERILTAAVFIGVGLLLSAIAAFGFLSLAGDNSFLKPHLWFVLSGVAGMLGLLSIGWGMKALLGRKPSVAIFRDDLPADQDDLERSRIVGKGAIVPPDQAEALVREIAEKHGATTALNRVGNFRPDHLDNARTHIAEGSAWKETPLALIDTSVRRNAKSGVLVTNRRLYSSLLPQPIPLQAILKVSHKPPRMSHLWRLLFLRLVLGPIYLLLWIIYYRDCQQRASHRLLVNGKLIYAGRRFRPEFWIEMLTALAEAAREVHLASPPPPSAGNSLRIAALDTTPHSSDGKPLIGERHSHPTWKQIKESIRALNGHTHPLVRLWAGPPDSAPALEIRGGNGIYSLRERGDGWVDYDPGAGDEEVEVQTSGDGYRCPAFYVCRDVGRVLEIARRFCETGTFGDDPETENAITPTNPPVEPRR